MFVRHKPSNDLVEVLDFAALVDPLESKIQGRFHAGEELQDEESFKKSDLIFPSGEPLPRCWLDSTYRQTAR